MTSKGEQLDRGLCAPLSARALALAPAAPAALAAAALAPAALAPSALAPTRRRSSWRAGSGAAYFGPSRSACVKMLVEPRPASTRSAAVACALPPGP